MTSVSLPVVSVLGGGSVGRVLLRLLADCKAATAGDIVCRSAASAASAASFVGNGARPLTLLSLEDGAAVRADIWLLCVPDAALRQAAASLARGLTAATAGSGELYALPLAVLHVSGALPASLVAAELPPCVPCASVHPAAAFSRAGAELQCSANGQGLHGVTAAVEGDEAALAAAAPLISALGMRTLKLATAAKPLYHASAVLASNGIVALLAAAESAAVAATGLPPGEARSALIGPLVSRALEAALRLGPVAALTGPAARGDTATVEASAAALVAFDAGHASLYSAVTEGCLRLAAERARGADYSGSRPDAKSVAPSPP